MQPYRLFSHLLLHLNSHRVVAQVLLMVGSMLFTACASTQSAAPMAATPITEAATNGYPVTIENCGVELTYDAAPQRAVTMNQAATEIMLALGLESRMVGTAGLDDAVPPQWAAAYASVPILSDVYPGQETLFGEQVDFVYGSYRSAFGDEAAGARTELATLDIMSYLSEASCEDAALRPAEVTFATLFDEILDIGRIFGVEARAQAVVAEMQGTLDTVAASIGEDAQPVSVFWYDSETDAPYAGSCCGAPAMMMAAVGATNIFADAPGTWASVMWEEVVARNPQVIVLADAEWSTATEKRDLLRNDPRFASLDAVQNQRFVTIPFAGTTLGVRNVDGVVTLARGLYPDQSDAPPVTSNFPVTIANCGVEITYAAPPKRAVSMNQSTTEIMLSLGLQAQMVGTGNLVDVILPELEAAYQSVPILAEKYPAQEVVLAAEPDFVYGAFRGAFADTAAGSRANLLTYGINSYVSPLFCEDRALAAPVATFELLYGEIRDIGHVFGVEGRAEALIAEMQVELDAMQARVGDPDRPVRVLWFDSNLDEPFVGACCGAPAMLMAAAGAENVFADTDGTWATVGWETIVERSPDVIVFVESTWSTVPDQMDYLLNEPTFSSIPAVQNQRFVTVPFSATTMGVRNVAGVVALAKALYPEKFE